MIEQCFTSPPTQYRLYGRRFLQVKDPTNNIKVLKEKDAKENNTKNIKKTEIHTHTKYTVSQKKTVPFIFTVTLANVGRFLKLNSFNVGIRKKWLITRMKNFPL